jgi:hypothetical protein
VLLSSSLKQKTSPSSIGTPAGLCDSKQAAGGARRLLGRPSAVDLRSGSGRQRLGIVRRRVAWESKPRRGERRFWRYVVGPPVHPKRAFPGRITSWNSQITIGRPPRSFRLELGGDWFLIYEQIPSWWSRTCGKRSAWLQQVLRVARRHHVLPPAARTLETPGTAHQGRLCIFGPTAAQGYYRLILARSVCCAV